MVDPEISRQVVHVFVGTFALLLRWLHYPAALFCAAAAVTFNLLILPRLPWSSRYLYRRGERAVAFASGILLYPISVLVLILVFPVPVAASMWGVLSFGDGAATMVGRRIGRRPLPWNRGKTVEGLAGFLAAGIPAALFLYRWTVPNEAGSPPWWRGAQCLAIFHLSETHIVFAVAVATVFCCAILETLRLRVDDNITVPLAGACIMVGLLYALSR